LRRGQIQQEILAALDTGDPAAIDFDLAQALIRDRLTPVQQGAAAV
jgi:hypothetical protein